MTARVESVDPVAAKNKKLDIMLLVFLAASLLFTLVNMFWGLSYREYYYDFSFFYQLLRFFRTSLFGALYFLVPFAIRDKKMKIVGIILAGLSFILPLMRMSLSLLINIFN